MRRYRMTVTPQYRDGYGVPSKGSPVTWKIPEHLAEPGLKEALYMTQIATIHCDNGARMDVWFAFEIVEVRDDIVTPEARNA